MNFKIMLNVTNRGIFRMAETEIVLKNPQDGAKLSSMRSTVFLLLFVVILWGINVVMIKYLTYFFPPLALAPIRISLATCLLVPIVFKTYGLCRIPKRLFLPLSGVALFSIFLHHLSLSWGVAATSATHAALILGLNPLCTSLMASRWAGEPLSKTKTVGIVLGFCGVAIVVWGKAQGTATLTGDLVMFMATLTAVTGSLFIKYCTRELPVLVVTAYTHLAASVGLLLFGIGVNSVWYDSAAFAPLPMAVLLFSSFINTAMGAWWWNTGIQRIGASKSSLFQNGIPIAGVFASVVFLGEPLRLEHILALLLVVVGVSLGTGILRMPYLHR